MALKRKFLFDGEEIPGLVETSDLRDEEGTVEVPGFNRKVPIKDGVKMFQPLDTVHKIQRDTVTEKFLYDWFNLDQQKDVTVIDTDATGIEVSRFLLRDCENSVFSKRNYSADGIAFYGVASRITCSSTPVRIEN